MLTRFAPSPTGFLHLGSLRTVLFNHLIARNANAKWILRIEDTDQARLVPKAVESLISTLQWAKLDFDYGPGKSHPTIKSFHQSDRLEIYNHHLQPLIDEGKAYHCFCTPERLTKTKLERQKVDRFAGGYDRKCSHLTAEQVQEQLTAKVPSIIRFKSTGEGLTQNDLVYDPIVYPSTPIEDFVLRKSDGFPTYHFASVVDDHTMGITHVLRGEEWLPSTPKHLVLYKALGFEPPVFGHLPLLINKDGSKLSKRMGDVRVEDFIEKSYEPEALLNFVALMGWSRQATNTSISAPTSTNDKGKGKAKEEEIIDTDVMTMQELINNFSIGAINKNRTILSFPKLDFLNRAHLQLKLNKPADSALIEAYEIELKALTKRLSKIVEVEFPTSDRIHDLNFLARVLFALKERIFTLKDVPTIGPYFFSPPSLSTPLALSLQASIPLQTYTDVLSHTIEALSILSLDAFETNSTIEIGKTLIEIQNSDERFKGKGLMSTLRHALTGTKVGASVAATISVLGKEETLNRLQFALARVSNDLNTVD